MGYDPISRTATTLGTLGYLGCADIRIAVFTATFYVVWRMCLSVIED